MLKRSVTRTCRVRVLSMIFCIYSCLGHGSDQRDGFTCVMVLEGYRLSKCVFGICYSRN